MYAPHLDDRAPLIVITDVEPDDMAAFYVLHTKRIPLAHVLVIDRSAEDAWQREARFVDLMTLLGTDVAHDYVTAETAGAALAAVLDAHPKCVRVLCLANFLPLVDLVASHPQRASALTVWAYGSINLRWALKSTEAGTVLHALNHGFAHFCVFETYAAFGERNVAMARTTPAWSAWLNDAVAPSEAARFLRDAIRDWNDQTTDELIAELYDTHLVGTDGATTKPEFEALLKQIPTSDPAYTSAKILLHLLEDDSEMVFADVGAALAATHPDWHRGFAPCTIGLIGGRFVSPDHHNPTGRAFYYKTPEIAQRETLTAYGDLAAALFAAAFPQ